MATLTGAARVALGPELPALFADDDALAADLLGAGAEEGDPLWRLPLWQPYREMLKSPVADINNVSTAALPAPSRRRSICADSSRAPRPWAHIDTFAWNQKPGPAGPRAARPGRARAADHLLAARHG